MKRAWVAVSMLCLVIILCITGLIFTNRNISSIDDKIKEAYAAVSQEDFELAKQYSEEIDDLWQKHYRVFCTYIPHEKLELIDQSISTLQTNLAYEEYAQFSTELNRSSAQLNHLRDTEMPTLENIL